MIENEPKIEYEPNPEKREGGVEIPETEDIDNESDKSEEEVVEKEEVKKKKEEIVEKKEAHEKEVEELISIAKEKSFSKALKRAKKLSKKKSAIIIDRFHDRLSQEEIDD